MTAHEGEKDPLRLCPVLQGRGLVNVVELSLVIADFRGEKCTVGVGSFDSLNWRF